MERTYMFMERAAHRLRSTAKGFGSAGWSSARTLSYAVQPRDTGHTPAEIVAKTGITEPPLYRHLPPLARAAADRCRT
jgi:uncharacterized protein involved in high-affinity Fe2+ transport